MAHRSDYETMADWQLEGLCVKYGIRPTKRVGERFYFDREHAIDALVNRDAGRCQTRFDATKSDGLEADTIAQLKPPTATNQSASKHEATFPLPTQAAARGRAATGAESRVSAAPSIDRDLSHDGESIAARKARREAVVNPILQQRRWKPGRLATKAGVSKNSVYEYLDGTRVKIKDENREAIAQALDLKPEDLPD